MDMLPPALIMASMKAYVLDLAIIPKLFTKSLCVTSASTCIVLDDCVLSGIILMNSRRKTFLLEQKALMILLINCWKSALDAEVSEIVSESLEDEETRCEQYLLQKVAETSLTRDIRGDRCTPQRIMFT